MRLREQVARQKLLHLGKDLVAFLRGGLGVGVGDESFAGFGGDAQFEIERDGAFDTEPLDHEEADETAGSGTGGGLELLGRGADVLAEGDGAEVGAFVEEGDVSVDDKTEELRAIGEEGFEENFLESGAEVVHVANGDRIDNGLLIGEEAVKRADGDAGGFGDAAGGDLFERHLGEQARGAGVDLLDGIEAAFLNGGATHFLTIARAEW